MNKHQLRVQETLQYFTQKDIGLAFRKLLDCAADTQQMSIYEKAIALTDWKEKHPAEVETLIEKATVLLREIADCKVTELPTETAVLVAEEVRKHYALGRFQLGPISLSIKKGQVYGLVGENGNGKTTLLRILARDLSYDSGVVKYYFTERPKNDYDLRTKLIYIPQRTEKWYGSLKDNLKFTLSSYGIPAEENELRTLLMIARLGLWQYQHLDWNALSSGYKMRFELARTLLRQPEILLLDEPLGNLDVLAQQVILEDLKMIANSVNHPIALILSSQQLFEVEKISDKVIFLRNGQYTDNAEATATEEAMPLIVEIDTTNTREELMAVFKAFALEKLNYNGGVYVAYFRPNTEYSAVLEALGKAKIDLTYIRNISASTRRFFVS
ncbi:MULTISPECIES: ATP-binding cassette domain-containing protein [Capnocytophaga]|jgi:ABC transporter, ATP-binding protein|uniref:ABC transporter ATP-binding protein n=1 Tax=Capnocytophaga TaxID=1016 RepID=UPI00020C7877|nr:MULTISPECIES: ABC transporter ATP-binding protein [Capnocytophaga]KHE68241.1 ABC transporter, ATP-binding protein [Capnocytophaga sp. oral taxon 329 str. F0087]QGS17285.1 ATP-binding cassette domain-containing protein [Capnocytophaga sp. FDAARGOS_737]